MDILSNPLELVATSLLSTALAATPVLAQSGQAEPVRQTQTECTAEKGEVRIVTHDTFAGAPVTNGREGDAQEKLGSIWDLVLDGQNGQVRYAVVASGGTIGIGKRQTLIPWHSLAWDEKHSRFTLSMTAEALQKLPEFDPNDLQHLGRRSAADAGSDRGDGKAGDATNRRRVDLFDDAAGDELRSSDMLASRIGDCAVLAGTEEVGSGDTLFIAAESGCTAFLSVSSGGVLGIGGTSYVVPWAALRLVEPIGRPELQIQLAKGKSALEGAPKLGDDGADVNNAQFREKVYRFYGVDPPAFEHASDEHASDERSAKATGHSDRR